MSYIHDYFGTCGGLRFVQQPKHQKSQKLAYHSTEFISIFNMDKVRLYKILTKKKKLRN